jgi:2-amino-4-hydroxy-6-hydroxymethyldihydropteridine diphosphokinase
MNAVYLGLGSNLEDPVLQVQKAIAAIANLPQTSLVQVSSLYQSPPLLKPGAPTKQPDYINVVAEIETQLSPHELLQQCQLIEQRQGRRRGPAPWAPRTLDLDILLYGQKVISDDRLTIPHSGLVERNFVLYPLFEIAPDLVLPQHGPVASLIAGCIRGDLQRLPLEISELTELIK